MRIPVVERILHANEVLASEVRRRLDEAAVFSVNLMASPGAGKTSFITGTIERLRQDLSHRLYRWRHSHDTRC